MNWLMIRLAVPDHWLMIRLEAPDVPEDEREGVYLSETFAERPLTAIHWMLEQVTAMVVPEKSNPQ